MGFFTSGLGLVNQSREEQHQDAIEDKEKGQGSQPRGQNVPQSLPSIPMAHKPTDPKHSKSKERRRHRTSGKIQSQGANRQQVKDNDRAQHQAERTRQFLTPDVSDVETEIDEEFEEEEDETDDADDVMNVIRRRLVVLLYGIDAIGAVVVAGVDDSVVLELREAVDGEHCEEDDDDHAGNHWVNLKREIRGLNKDLRKEARECLHVNL